MRKHFCGCDTFFPHVTLKKRMRKALHACVLISSNLETHVRNPEESDSCDTDDESTWHGIGKFEYSGKVLPHALFHATELVIRGGHHAAFCTFSAEQGHKRYIKSAATFARVYASSIETEQHMLEWVNEQTLWNEVMEYLPEPPRVEPRVSHVATSDPSITLKCRLQYCQGWSGLKITNNRLPVSWTSKFLSHKVRLTHLELFRLICVKLRVQDSHLTHSVLFKELDWEFWGQAVIKSNGCSRTFVGVQEGRRDFVRLQGVCNNTCLSAQLIVFLKISGLQDIMAIPDDLKNQPDDSNSITFALIRWLSPNPNALLRDDSHRPICVSPFDINHALWVFSTTDRLDLTDDIISANQSCYPDIDTMIGEYKARYDLVLPESLNQYMNCTLVDDGNILETITLPF